MIYRNICLFAVIFVLCSFHIVTSIIIEKNAYKRISISFSESVHESNFDFEKLKAILSRSSELLYHATRKRAFFGEFVASLPPTWAGDGCGSHFTNDAPKGVDVHLTDRTDAPTLTAKHSGGCGERGDIVYMPLQWMKGKTEDLAHQFVKQWSIYRYGVFEEDPIEDGLCFMSKAEWSPAGCYDLKINAEPTLKNGVPFCPLSDDFFEKNQFKSSLMSQSNSSEILNFCDGSESYPHNPAAPTLHNNLCEGKTVWSVIESSDDFNYGKNLPLQLDKPPFPTSFKCFKEKPIQVTFAIQNNTVNEDLSTAMVELGYSLYQFLSNMLPSETKANVVTFSDNKEDSKPVELDLKDPTQLEKTISLYVRTVKSVSNTCLRCGLKKALEASQANNHPSPIVVLIAWESSLLGEKPSLLAESIQSFLPKVRLHLLLVEDTDAEVLSSTLVDAVRTTGGNIYSLPKKPVLMASKLHVLLAGVVKNHLQIEDNIVVIHESTYSNITQSFTDSFSIPSNVAEAKLVYNMYCDLGRIVQEKNPNCTFEKSASVTFKCGEIRNFNNQVKHSNSYPSITTLEYPFEYQGGTTLPTCSSMAMLLLSSSSKKPPTLRGWLNNYQITIGHDALIIYAEIAGSSGQRNSVFATVSSSVLITPITIRLLDNGNGDPDVKADDGIYSRYFSSFSKKGTYVVSISTEVSNENDNLFTDPGHEKRISNFVQKKIIGSFSVKEDAPSMDILPPNRIADLSVISIDHGNSTVTLQWTAPGNDYDFGKAAAYEVYFTEDWKDLQESMLSKITSKTLESTDINQPQSSGETEQATFELPKKESKVWVYYIAVRGVDHSQNRGKISNTIQVVIGTQYDKLPNKNITGNETETSTESIDQSNHEMITLAKCYIMLGGSAAVILLILIINVLIWGLCFRKHKKRWKELQNTVSDGEVSTAVKDLAGTVVEDESVYHSYTNPIMERSRNAEGRNRAEHNDGSSDPSVAYAKVVKKDKRDRDIYQMEKIGKQENGRHSERDLGLV